MDLADRRGGKDRSSNLAKTSSGGAPSSSVTIDRTSS